MKRRSFLKAVASLAPAALGVRLFSKAPTKEASSPILDTCDFSNAEHINADYEVSFIFAPGVFPEGMGNTVRPVRFNKTNKGDLVQIVKRYA